MIFTRVALLLFLLYESSFSHHAYHSQACLDVRMEPQANHCLEADIKVVKWTNVNGSVLEDYCSPTCRDLIIRYEDVCFDDLDEDALISFINLTCSVNSNSESCLQFFINVSYYIPMDCFDNDKTCTSECTMILQSYVDYAGCCYNMNGENAGYHMKDVSAFSSSFQVCNLSLPSPQLTCQVLGKSSNSGGGSKYGDCGGSATCLKAVVVGFILTMAVFAASL